MSKGVARLLYKTLNSRLSDHNQRVHNCTKTGIQKSEGQREQVRWSVVRDRGEAVTYQGMVDSIRTIIGIITMLYENLNCLQPLQAMSARVLKHSALSVRGLG